MIPARRLDLTGKLARRFRFLGIMIAQLFGTHRFTALGEDLVKDMIKGGFLCAFASSPALLLIMMLFRIPEDRLEIVWVNPDLVSSMAHRILAEREIKAADAGFALSLIPPGLAASQTLVTQPFDVPSSPDIDRGFFSPAGQVPREIGRLWRIGFFKPSAS